jgi:hypothetical protein
MAANANIAANPPNVEDLANPNKYFQYTKGTINLQMIIYKIDLKIISV